MAGAIYARAIQITFGDLRERGENTLRLAEASLRGQLARFERLPGLLAEERVLRSLLLAPNDQALVGPANLYLRETARRLGASDIYVMSRDGLTLAASNFDQPHSFVGGNFAFRPYFRDAINGGEGRFFALGTTSNKRGYYFGAPVDVGGIVRGVLVIKIDLDEIEMAWASNDLRIVVMDPEGIVFLSNRPDWLFRALAPLDPEAARRTRETRRYADAEVGTVPAVQSAAAGGFQLLRAATDGAETEYLLTQAEMEDAGWTVMVLSPTAGARRQALLVVTALLLGLGAVGFAGLIVWLRRRQLAERIALQAATQAQLERRVVERTAELASVNSALRQEVEERIATEVRLRDTQAELVQAGKLAALGQMSAALSHEFNQPLAAARTYAENAGLYLERGQVAEAEQNIGHIIGMIERMGRISRHLRNFARKPHQKLRVVSVAAVVQEAQELLGWRLQKAGAELIVDIVPENLCVTAGAVRLQQVLVNLLTNALDATEDATDRRLHLSARRQGDMALICLRDHGPGVPDQVVARIFDPFFSTKGVGKGLGLGLSISYNIVRDFGGTLEVRNPPEGGAEFMIRLRAAEADTPSAEAAE
jgi:two-component system C4-dicarboxylate transport sensor histidine kinase DctB